jgi:regulator of protease activity HflC (stomatin/prohibitin superfamily)
VLTAYRKLAKPADHLYRELQFRLHAAVGTRSLDELLENKSVIDELVTAQVSQRLAAYGLALEGVGVKDIVLPGEMKTILAQVVEAGKSAEANVIRRREETAATRSLLNAAR